MKLFPDVESRKRFMKTSLFFLLGIAWTPVIWVIVAAMVGKPMVALMGWPVMLGISGMMTLFFIFLFLRFFNRSGKKFNDDSQ